MGFVNSVVLVLQRRLQAHREQIWDTILNNVRICRRMCCLSMCCNTLPLACSAVR